MMTKFKTKLSVYPNTEYEDSDFDRRLINRINLIELFPKVFTRSPVIKEWELIGKGKSGFIYKCHTDYISRSNLNNRILDNYIAIKIIKPDLEIMQRYAYNDRNMINIKNYISEFFKRKKLIYNFIIKTNYFGIKQNILDIYNIEYFYTGGITSLFLYTEYLDEYTTLYHYIKYKKVSTQAIREILLQGIYIIIVFSQFNFYHNDTNTTNFMIKYLKLRKIKEYRLPLIKNNVVIKLDTIYNLKIIDFDLSTRFLQRDMNYLKINQLYDKLPLYDLLNYIFSINKLVDLATRVEIFEDTKFTNELSVLGSFCFGDNIDEFSRSKLIINKKTSNLNKKQAIKNIIKILNSG